jgi:hypothetical protein
MAIEPKIILLAIELIDLLKFSLGFLGMFVWLIGLFLDRILVTLIIKRAHTVANVEDSKVVIWIKLVLELIPSDTDINRVSWSNLVIQVIFCLLSNLKLFLTSLDLVSIDFSLEFMLHDNSVANCYNDANEESNCND